MTLLRFARRSDAPPPARELLEVADDGSMTGWLSQGPLVGACRGPVPDLEGLRALVEAAARSPVPTPGDAPLDATIDALDVAGREHAWPEHEVVAGPWGDLLAAARTLLLDALPAMPAAAVGLAFPGPDRLRLEHRGGAPLVLELGAAWAEVTRWRDGVPVGSAETRDLRLGRVEAGPGWSAEVPLAVPGGEAGDLLTASAWFVADDEGIHVPVVLTGRGIAG